MFIDFVYYLLIKKRFVITQKDLLTKGLFTSLLTSSLTSLLASFRAELWLAQARLVYYSSLKIVLKLGSFINRAEFYVAQALFV